MKKLFFTITLMLVALTANAQSCPDGKHPHMIDLGLPSGTKWACCNVDASKPEEDGGYYAWGETTTKSEYSWKTYKLCDGTEESCHNFEKSFYSTQYDVAHVKWGAPWQMASLDDIMEFEDECKSEWTTVNGVKGRRFTGPNGCSIFLPAAGCWDGSNLVYRGEKGCYWLGALGYQSFAFYLNFSSDKVEWIDISRMCGLTVRPVAK